LGRQTKGSDTKLNFTHDFEACVNTFHGVNMASFRNGLVNAGIKDGEFMIWSELMDAKTLFLTANADTVYFFGYADLSKGPMVFEAPPGALGVIDDMWWRWASDFGAPGPTAAWVASTCLSPQVIPVNCRRAGSSSYTRRRLASPSWCRAFMENNDPKPAVEAIRKFTKVHPYEVGGVGISIAEFLTGKARLVSRHRRRPFSKKAPAR
jgi:hypothetical protein